MASNSEGSAGKKIKALEAELREERSTVDALVYEGDKAIAELKAHNDRLSKCVYYAELEKQERKSMTYKAQRIAFFKYMETEGVGYHRAAKALGISMNTARSWAYRARKAGKLKPLPLGGPRVATLRAPLPPVYIYAEENDVYYVNQFCADGWEVVAAHPACPGKEFEWRYLLRKQVTNEEPGDTAQTTNNDSEVT